MNGSSSTLQIPTPRVFSRLLEPARYKGAWGGRGSGKSHFFAELLVEKAVERPGLRAACIREVQKSLAQSVKRLIEDKIASLGVGHLFRVLESEIETPGGGLIIFQGMQNHTAESIKSLEGYNIAWVEEAQSLSQRSLDLLRPTIRKDGSELWFSWNPRHATDPVDALLRCNSLEAKEKNWRPPPGSVVVEVNWKDNPWFPAVLREEKDYDQRRDPDKYAHVWLGGYQSSSESRVFRNWRIIDEVEIPAEARRYYGADWGFATDPSVLVRAWLWDRTLYIDREAYAVNCEIDYLPALFAGSDSVKPPRWENPHKYPGIEGAADWPITADSSRPETISYVARRGLRIAPAVKGPGSLEDGIEFLKNFDIVVHPSCVHTIDELTLYSYKTDRLTEEILPELADKDNHVIDALRYAVEGVRRAMVFQTSTETFIKPPIDIPAIFTRCAAVELDRNRLAVLWAAYNRSTDTVYLYDEYVAPRAQMAVHAEAMRQRGRWIPAVFDLEGKDRSHEEGVRIAEHLDELGVQIFDAPIDMGAALDSISIRLDTGRLVVFGHLSNWIAEYRRYRRDHKDDVSEDDDLLMRATAGIVINGLQVAISENRAASDERGYDPVLEAPRGAAGY